MFLNIFFMTWSWNLYFKSLEICEFYNPGGGGGGGGMSHWGLYIIRVNKNA